MLRDWLEKIASDQNLRGEDFRVLLVLFANAEGKGVEIAQTEIAQKLDFKKPRVARAIGRGHLTGNHQQKADDRKISRL